MKMKIAIIGAGALGSLFGGLLAEAGREVWLYNPHFVEHIERINAEGLVIEEEGRERRVKIKATTKIEDIGVADLVALFVKAPDTEEAIKGALPTIGRDTWVLSLQNGLGIAEEIAKWVDKARILRGITTLGSTLVGPGKIVHAGKGDTVIGRVRGGEVHEIINAFNEAGIRTLYDPDVERLVWEKLLINLGINALTAVFNVRNGELVRDRDLREVMREVIEEGVEVACRHGLGFSPDEVIAKAEDVCRLTGDNISSMLQDIRRGRRTEIDYINGAIVREGERLGVGTPLNRLLTKLVKVKSMGAGLRDRSDPVGSPALSPRGDRQSRW